MKLKDLWTLWILYRTDKAAAVKEIIMNDVHKPGWKTTEFWLTLMSQVPMVLGIFLGASNPITIAVGAATAIAYTLGRNWSKAKAMDVAMAALQAGAEAAKQVPPPPAQP